MIYLVDASSPKTYQALDMPALALRSALKALSRSIDSNGVRTEKKLDESIFIMFLEVGCLPPASAVTTVTAPATAMTAAMTTVARVHGHRVADRCVAVVSLLRVHRATANFVQGRFAQYTQRLTAEF